MASQTPQSSRSKSNNSSRRGGGRNNSPPPLDIPPEDLDDDTGNRFDEPEKEVEETTVDVEDPITRTETRPRDTLDVGDITKAVATRDVIKENAAERIATSLIRVFLISLLSAFIVVALLIVGPLIANPEATSVGIYPVMSDILEVIKIIGGIFSPLLAFILGYYFSLTIKKGD